jgi:prefoldin subunit 5
MDNNEYQINLIIDEIETIKTAIKGLEETAKAMDTTIEKMQANITAYDKLMELTKKGAT